MKDPMVMAQDVLGKIEDALSTMPDFANLTEGEKDMAAWATALGVELDAEGVEAKAALVLKDGRSREDLSDEEKAVVDRSVVSILSRKLVGAISCVSSLRGKLKDARLAIHLIGCPASTSPELKEVLNRVYAAQKEEKKG